jgi:ABC-type sugar transport system ATPase subunit
MNLPPRLELDRVGKAYAGREAVRDLSLALGAGEFVSLLGPSGCGKSTTLAMIAGFEDPDAGSIRVDGDRIDDLPAGRRGIGIVFQDYAVFTRMSVRDNLVFGLEAQRVPRSARAAAVEQIAHQFRLIELLERRGDRLNVSEMQRVALARALVTRPRLLLLDEPMSNPDSSLRAQLRSELRRVQRQLGQSVLYVTHDQVEALAMSDRIAVMSEGCLVQVGPPLELYHRPLNRFVAEFIGDPPINILPCTLRCSGRETMVHTVGGCTVQIEADPHAAGEHLLGVRPEHVRVAVQPAGGHGAGVVRFIEDLGSEHVLHIECGDDLVRILASPGTAGLEDRVGFTFDSHHAVLLDRVTGVALQPGRRMRQTVEATL